MDNRTQLEIETYELWNSFKDEVYHKNRFFITHPLLEILKNTFQNIHSILKLIQYIIELVSLMKRPSKIIL